jgi:hypothetical protein
VLKVLGLIPVPKKKKKTVGGGAQMIQNKQRRINGNNM